MVAQDIETNHQFHMMGSCCVWVKTGFTMQGGMMYYTGWWCNNIHFNHLEKWWSSSMGRNIPYMKWKINKMLETTNQYILLFPIYGKIIQPCSKPPSPVQRLTSHVRHQDSADSPMKILRRSDHRKFARIHVTATPVTPCLLPKVEVQLQKCEVDYLMP